MKEARNKKVATVQVDRLSSIERPQRGTQEKFNANADIFRPFSYLFSLSLSLFLAGWMAGWLGGWLFLASHFLFLIGLFLIAGGGPSSAEATVASTGGWRPSWRPQSPAVPSVSHPVRKIKRRKVRLIVSCIKIRLTRPNTLTHSHTHTHTHTHTHLDNYIHSGWIQPARQPLRSLWYKYSLFCPGNLPSPFPSTGE